VKRFVKSHFQEEAVVFLGKFEPPAYLNDNTYKGAVGHRFDGQGLRVESEHNVRRVAAARSDASHDAVVVPLL
jgi:hypothetical protein